MRVLVVRLKSDWATYTPVMSETNLTPDTAPAKSPREPILVICPRTAAMFINRIEKRSDLAKPASRILRHDTPRAKTANMAASKDTTATAPERPTISLDFTAKPVFVHSGLVFAGHMDVPRLRDAAAKLIDVFPELKVSIKTTWMTVSSPLLSSPPCPRVVMRQEAC